MRTMILACILSALAAALGLHFLVHRPQVATYKAEVSSLAAANRSLQEGLQASERDRQLHRVLLVRKIASEAALRASRDTLEADLAAALAQNAAWAAQPVPQEVQDALTPP